MRKGKRICEDADGVLLVGVWIDNHTEHVRAATALEIEAYELERPDPEPDEAPSTEQEIKKWTKPQKVQKSKRRKR